MKLTTCKTKVKANTTVPGLIKGTVEYSIQSATSTLEWAGPKINPELWNAILEFFWDTYRHSKSESQVRLYVNTKDRKWAAWAYPQEARTGMSAREIDNPQAKEQREMFKDSDGWIYAGTVHHHCDCTAFQSGTDHMNEKDQDGLHITVGHINKKHHDIHCRFYFDGLEYAPDMAAFWDIGQAVKDLIPPDCWDRAARHQMTVPAPNGTVYPEQWKANLIEAPKIEVRRDFTERGVYHGGVNGIGISTGKNGNSSETTLQDNISQLPEWKRKELALKAIYLDCAKRGVNIADVEAHFKFFSLSPFVHVLRNVAGHSRVLIWDVISEWEKEADRETARQQLIEYGHLGI